MKTSIYFFLMLMMVLTSGIFAINTQYQVRKLYTVLDLENKALTQLKQEYDRLMLKKSELSSQQVMERKAREFLQMVPISPEHAFYPHADKGGEQS